MIRTKVTELLDKHGVPYRLLPHAEPAFTVEAAAEQRGVPIDEMVKCILLRDRGGRYALACVTGEAQLDVQAVRAHLPAEWKRLSFAAPEEIEAVTGSVQGAVAPLGLPQSVPVVFDEAVARRARVNISSGDPRAGLELDPQALMALAQPRLGRIAK
jgi:Cys-tRNA(Pro)/Cys-tRNA(Cys) deacylase